MALNTKAPSNPPVEQDRMVRLLMALLATLVTSEDETVRRGAVTKQLPRRSKNNTELIKDYAEAMKELKTAGAMSEEKGLLTLDRGMICDRLLAELAQSGFEFQGPLGKRKANVLLQLIRELVVAPSLNKNGNGNGKVEIMEPITSYEEFKTVAMETVRSLDKSYNMDNLVPIYRVRRELGERIGREEFNNWFLELQAEDMVQLIGGQVPELTPDKAADSIETALGGFRFYIQTL